AARADPEDRHRRRNARIGLRAFDEAPLRLVVRQGPRRMEGRMAIHRPHGSRMDAVRRALARRPRAFAGAARFAPHARRRALERRVRALHAALRADRRAARADGDVVSRKGDALPARVRSGALSASSTRAARQRRGRVGAEIAAVARWLSSVHRPNGLPNACLVSAPRSGSTWLLELVLTQPGFRPCNEPFNLRKPEVVRRLGLTEWTELNDSAHLPEMKAYLESFLANRYSAAFKGLRPGLPYHRFVTRRIAFKILFACEHRLDWLADTLRAQLVLLIRHPLPVALSRTALPR